MGDLLKKNFNQPDKTETAPKVKVETININGYVVKKDTYEPGWKWSIDIKPLAKTEWCEDLHVLYQVSGRQHVHMKDGTEVEIVPGDVHVIPPGHDGWVVGDEPAVVLDLTELVKTQHGE